MVNKTEQILKMIKKKKNISTNIHHKILHQQANIVTLLFFYPKQLLSENAFSQRVAMRLYIYAI